MTEITKEEDVPLQKVTCVHYLIRFKKKEVQALIDSGSEVNAMSLAYTSNLGLKVRHTDVGAQKIDGSIL